MTNNLEDEVKRIVESMENQESQDNTQTPQEEIQDIYVLIVRESEEEEENPQIVDSTPTVPTQPAPVTIQQDSFLSTYVFVCCSLFLILSTLTFQCYCMVNPLVATITILPRSQTATLAGTLQLGRVLPPLTISQSQTTPATGKEHQDARQATGTILTGASRIQVETDQDAMIPAGNPASGYGRITVAAHAINPGSNGNIAAYDMNQACCATSVLAVNLLSFHGGQDERTYTTVTQKDIHSISTVLTTSLTQSMHRALQGQVHPNEQLQILPCTPTVVSDHQPGEEATTVKVTVSQTCSAVAYNSQELQTKATAFLASQALHKTGTGYSLFGNVQVSVREASVTSTTHPLVFLWFHASSTWVYGLAHTAQEQIKHLIANKTTQQAVTLLASLPGVEQASIRLSGFGDNTRLPKNTGYIHLTIFVV